MFEFFNLNVFEKYDFKNLTYLLKDIKITFLNAVIFCSQFQLKYYQIKMPPKKKSKMDFVEEADMAELKRKIEDENRKFQEKWEEMYFFVETNNRIQCLICQQTIAVAKEFNLSRHYNSLHGNKFKSYLGKVRTEKIIQFKSSFEKQTNLFAKCNKKTEDSVKASYVICQMIAKASKPFTEGLFVKDCMVQACEIMCPEKKKVFEGISLSANTVSARITELADDTKKQLVNIAKDFEAYSIAIDESTDTTDTAQCAVFIRGVDKHFKITEELLELIPLRGTTTGKDIFQKLEECITKAELPWTKLVNLATDGAPAMLSENVGVVGLLKNKLHSLSPQSIKFTSIHCILHQEALCGKNLQMKGVMEIVVKTVNFIRSRALNHRQFASFLLNNESQHGEILYHTEVRWLSRGKVLRRFFDLLEEIDSFMKSKNKEVPELKDSNFISNLAFLTDITEHLNDLNTKLQGKDQIITQMFDHIKSFKVKLSLWNKQISNGNFIHFHALKSLKKVEPNCLTDYSRVLNELLQQFDTRFKDFKALEIQFNIFSTPFSVDVESVDEDIQMELVELQCDTILKQKYSDVGIPEFYLYLQQDRFPNLHSQALRIIAMFGSTYLCEQFFSLMKFNKSSTRTKLTDEHLQATLRLASSQKIVPNIDALVVGKRCQLSSQK